MATKFAMFRADNLAGTTQGKYLASVRINVELENGTIVVPGAYEEGSREVRDCDHPTTDAQIAILGSEEVNKDVKIDTVGGFINKSGTIARAYILEAGDVFSVSADGFITCPEVGGVVKVAANTFSKMSTTGEVTVGTCVAIEQDGATTWYVVRV